MDVMSHRHPRGAAAGDAPWFRSNRRRSLVISVLLFAVVLALRFSIGTADDAIALLFSLPIALIAVTFGSGRASRRAPSRSGCSGSGRWSSPPT